MARVTIGHIVLLAIAVGVQFLLSDSHWRAIKHNLGSIENMKKLYTDFTRLHLDKERQVATANLIESSLDREEVGEAAAAAVAAQAGADPNADADADAAADRGPPAGRPQPDDVRTAGVRREDFVPEDCTDLATSSKRTTRGVTLTITSYYHGSNGPKHHFGYRIKMANAGPATVQMLTRHWLFYDFHGRCQEVKGPGAVGHTPVLRAGEDWEYESGCALDTDTGSVAGSFQFEVLDGARAGDMFDVPFARLGFSTDGRAVSVSCGRPAAGSGFLPATSVYARQRVIVGANTDFRGVVHNKKGVDGGELGAGWTSKRQYKYILDVQINNARTAPIVVKKLFFSVVDARGRTTHGEAEGMGVSRVKPDPVTGAVPPVVIAPGSANRVRFPLPPLYNDDGAYVFGHYTVSLDDDGLGGRRGSGGATRLRLPLAPLAMLIEEDEPLEVSAMSWWPPEGWDADGHWYTGEDGV